MPGPLPVSGVACGRVKSDLLSRLIRGKRSANAAVAQEGHPEPLGVFQEGLLRGG